MKITEVRIRPANEESVRAYASICFDDCFAVYDIRVIEAPTGLFISFPAKKQRDGTHSSLPIRPIPNANAGGIREMD